MVSVPFSLPSINAHDVELQVRLPSACGQMVDWIGTLSPIFQWKRSAVRRPTIAPVRVASQAFIWSGGRIISGCIFRNFSGSTGFCMKKFFGSW